MGLFGTIALVIIIYYGIKAIRDIWRDAFGNIGVDDDRTRKKQQQRQQREQYQQSQKKSRHKSESPIEKGEGDYVDYEEV